VHEQGPRTIRPVGLAGANTLELAEELGLADKVVPIISGHPATKNRFSSFCSLGSVWCP